MVVPRFSLIAKSENLWHLQKARKSIMGAKPILEIGNVHV